MLTTIDPQEYSPDEYIIVALPGENFKSKIMAIQQQLVHILGEAIWLTPPHALHVTVMEITGPDTLPVQHRAEGYAHWQQTYGQLKADTIAQFSAFSLQFDQVVLSPRAIILKASNPEQLNSLRAELLSKARLPTGTKLPPDIAHISIARYSEAIDLDAALQRCKSIRINHTESVTSLSLLKDITPPDFKLTTIATYPLAG